MADEWDAFAASITPCWRLGCDDIGTEDCDYTFDSDGMFIRFKLCLPCLRELNTPEGIDIEGRIAGHISIADAKGGI